MEDVDLFDVRYSGIQYTWCQKPAEGGIRRKLDRVLANVEFLSLPHDASANFLPRSISDHSPAILCFTAGIRKKVWSFRYDNFLSTHSSFLSVVKEGWIAPLEGSFMFRLVTRLKGLKAPLKRLRSTYGNLSHRMDLLKRELDSIQLLCDAQPDVLELQEDLMALRFAYHSACLDEEAATRQRAKIKWLNDGDANTKYFHHVVREKACG